MNSHGPEVMLLARGIHLGAEYDRMWCLSTLESEARMGILHSLNYPHLVDPNGPN